MIVKEIEGNLLDLFAKEEIDVLVHGANCFHIMGAGIAGQLAKWHPEVVEADKQSACGALPKLGTYTVAKIGKDQRIINAYTQYYPGPNFEYSAFMEFLEIFTSQLEGFKGIIGFPQIGCGIGGGDWETVKRIIHAYTTDLQIVIVHYTEEETVGTTKKNIHGDIEAKGLGKTTTDQPTLFEGLK